MAAATSAVVGGVLAAGAIGSTVAGGIASNNASKRASNTANAAAARFDNIQSPDYQAMKLQLDKMTSAGILSPQQEQNILQDPSQMNAVASDPRLKNAEMSALSTLGSISNEHGMDPASMAALSQAQSSNASAARGARDANLQNAAQRGVAGNGLEFVSNQMADQNAANSNAMVGTQAAADARAREMAALSSMGSLSANLDQNDIAQKDRVAQASDDINKFNTQTKQATQSTNVAANNAAQSANLTNAQNLSNQNTLIGNAEQQYNKELPQQEFNNNLAKAQGAAGLAGTQAQAQLASGQSMANLYGGLAQAGLGAAGSIYGNKKVEKV